MLKQKIILGLFVTSLAGLGCSGEENPNDINSTPCSGQSDCADGTACVRSGTISACQIECTADINACGSSGTCSGVGSMSVNVCQPEPESDDGSSSSSSSSSSGGGNTAQPDPEEQPALPCSSDAECAKLEAGSICALFKGSRDCTVPCTQESQCDMPAMMGYSVDFFTCIADEGDSSRDACLPDEACFSNPMSCMSVSFGDDDGDWGDDDDWDDSFGF
ncbi:MAG: hypothetical protein QGI45_12780 [Myxococcota bacterium]|nr:hypothetical protein [Myxococcota bacterium]